MLSIKNSSVHMFCFISVLYKEEMGRWKNETQNIKYISSSKEHDVLDAL